MSNTTRVLVKGLNWSGSGTVVDLLKEYRGVYQIPGGLESIAPAGYKKLGEFNDFRINGMVGDVLAERNDALKVLHQKAVERYMQHYSKKSFIKKIIKSRFKNPIRYAKHFQQLSNQSKVLLELAEELKSVDNIDTKVELCRIWVEKISSISSNGLTNAVIFDQPIHFDKHDEYWPEVFKPFKLIIVFRDPRDQIGEQIIRKKINRVLKQGHGYLHGWSINDAIDQRIKITEAMYKAADKTAEKLNSNDVLFISFEDMVQEYDKSKKLINDFLGLKQEDHVDKQKYFDPNWSKQNIGLYKDVEEYINDADLAFLMQWYKNKKNNE